VNCFAAAIRQDKRTTDTDDLREPMPAWLTEQHNDEDTVVDCWRSISGSMIRGYLPTDSGGVGLEAGKI
jgi:hypothetical protein